MARVKIQIPENKIFSLSIPVRITDINYGNHLGNDSFVGIIHEARVQWLRQFGYTELDVEGVGLIIGDLTIEFKNESFYGDHIDVAIFAGEISKVSFELFYQLTTERNNSFTVLALAKTGMVCYDYKMRKVNSVPGNLKTILQNKIPS